MFAQLLQSIRQVSAKAAIRLCKAFNLASCITVCLAFNSVGLSAQPELPVSQLLFEPVPIPAQGAAEGTERFNSLENMPPIISSDDIEDKTLDAATRLQISSDIEDYVEAVGKKEEEEGPYSEQLVQDLFSAGLLYQELEDHEQALDFFERSQIISRINEGLDTVAQEPMIQAKIESLMELGNIREADNAQDGLLQIYMDSYGAENEEIVPALLTLGDWNMQAFLERSNIALISRRMDVQSFMTQGLSSGSGPTEADKFFAANNESSSAPINKLFQAQNHFLSAVNILLSNQNYTHPDLLELERKLMTTSFLRTHQENIVYEPDFYLQRRTSATGTRVDTSSQDRLNSDDYDPGLKSLQRSLFYVSSNEQRTHLQVASAMLAEADWHMLFERKVVARRKYEEIYATFTENPTFGEFAGDAIYPKVPIILPTFLPAPNSREKLGISEDEEVSYFGYFDVTFSITRIGDARRIKINGQGGEVTRDMEIHLNQYLRYVLFRPLYDREGKLDTSELSLRYYVGI